MERAHSTAQHCRVNGVRLHVCEQGQGDRSLVFLHYWGGSSRTWSEVIQLLADDFRCVAYDQRGWGASEAPPSGYGIADLADDAEALVRARGLTRYTLVGHSMGGKVAQLLASRRPAGLEALVLVAPAPPVPPPMPEEQRAGMARAYTDRQSVAATLRQVLTARPLPEHLHERVIEDSLRGAPQAKAAWPEAAILEDISAHLAGIAAPTLVLAGEHDRVEPAALLEREVAGRIRGAQLRVVPGAGHLSPLEAPGELAAAIRAFLGARR